MSKNIPEKEKAEENTDAATLRHLHEFQQKAYWESTNILAKGMAFYLAITSALLGYVLTQHLSPPLPRLLIVAGLAISIFFFIAFSVWATGLLRQIEILENLTRALDPQIYKKLKMGSLFKRWRSVNKIIMAIIYLVGIVLVAAMLFVLFRANS